MDIYNLQFFIRKIEFKCACMHHPWWCLHRSLFSHSPPVSCLQILHQQVTEYFWDFLFKWLAKQNIGQKVLKSFLVVIFSHTAMDERAEKIRTKPYFHDNLLLKHILTHLIRYNLETKMKTSSVKFFTVKNMISY